MKTQTISCAALWTIAFFLSADFSLTYVRPLITLLRDQSRYAELARTCYEAMGNLNDVESISTTLRPAQFRLLRQAAVVSTMQCYAQEELRRSMLSAGVSEHQLIRIDLQAQLQSNFPIPNPTMYSRDQ